MKWVWHRYLDDLLRWDKNRRIAVELPSSSRGSEQNSQKDSHFCACTAAWETGFRLHEHVSGILEELGVRVVLEERPQVLPGGKSLRLSDAFEEYDLIVGTPYYRSAIIWLTYHRSFVPDKLPTQPF
jgi:hypothetical protein